MANMNVSKIQEHWTHEDFGSVKVVSAGHYPDTVMIEILEGDYKGVVAECPITDLVSDEDALATLNALLGNLLASKG